MTALKRARDEGAVVAVAQDVTRNKPFALPNHQPDLSTIVRMSATYRPVLGHILEGQVHAVTDRPDRAIFWFSSGAPTTGSRKQALTWLFDNGFVALNGPSCVSRRRTVRLTAVGLAHYARPQSSAIRDD